MKGFISFSGSEDVFDDAIGYWIDLMYQNKIWTSSTFSNPADHLNGDFSTSAMVGKDFYIGLITVRGKTLARAINEWNVALLSDKPTILLLDDKVKLPEGVVFNSDKVIKFNRQNPQKARQIIEVQMANCQPFTNENGIPVISRIASYFCCLSALTILNQLTKVTETTKVAKVKTQEAVLAV
jgi:hypothetical protein